LTVKHCFHVIRVRRKVWKRSFLDNEPILKHEHYLSKRAKRGLIQNVSSWHCASRVLIAIVI
jgi:hypothetical protein